MTSGVLLDLSGVIYEGPRAIPGAPEAVSRLRKSGLPLRFVTNTTRSPKQAIIRRLAEFGVAVAESELFTPAQAALDWLREHGCRPHLLIHPDLRLDFEAEFSGSGWAVVVGDAADAFDYASLNRAFRELIHGASLLALAKNRKFEDSDGELSLDAGPFVAALEFASERQATVLGKPSADFYEAALASMLCPAEEAVMIGDDAEADIAGALNAGVSVALLVRTGKYRDGDERRFDPAPTAVVDDVSAAVDRILVGRE